MNLQVLDKAGHLQLLTLWLAGVFFNLKSMNFSNLTRKAT